MEMVKQRVVKMRGRHEQYRALLFLATLAFSSLARADDNQGLRRGGDPNQVSISGLSSGAAMAL